MGTKIKCKLCGDVIEGDKKGTYISCSCGKCAIDETPHYTRINGDLENILQFTKDGNVIPLSNEIDKKPKVLENKKESNIFYLFLDIDGVLNDDAYIIKCWKKHNKPFYMNHVPFDPDCLNNLMILCQSLEAVGYEVKIILSSTWRLHEVDYEIVNARLAEYGLHLEGKTNYIHGERGIEIQDYLTNNPNYKDYIILDDDIKDIQEHHPNRYVRTSYQTGFTDKELKQALNMFSIENLITVYKESL